MNDNTTQEPVVKLNYLTAFLILLVISEFIFVCFDSISSQNKKLNNTKTQSEPNSVNPKEASFTKLGMQFYNQGEYEKAIEEFKNALKENPKSALNYNNLGASYNSLKQWDKAIIACAEAIKIDPSFQLAKNNLNWANDQLIKEQKK